MFSVNMFLNLETEIKHVWVGLYWLGIVNHSRVTEDEERRFMWLQQHGPGFPISPPAMDLDILHLLSFVELGVREDTTQMPNATITAITAIIIAQFDLGATRTAKLNMHQSVNKFGPVWFWRGGLDRCGFGGVLEVYMVFMYLMRYVFTKDDRVCEHPACSSKILKGDPCFYVTTVDPETPGHYMISGQVSYNSETPLESATMGTLASGYSEHHASYGSERECWAKISARLPLPVPPAQTISLEISAVHEGGTQRKGSCSITIGNICEGMKDIDAHIDAPRLIAIALDTMLPKIVAFCSGFNWRDDEFVVWDAKWVDLSKHPAGEPYFLSQCLQAGCKDSKVMIFKTNQFTLMVVAPWAQWLEYEDWAEHLTEDGGSIHIVQSNVVDEDWVEQLAEDGDSTHIVQSAVVDEDLVEELIEDVGSGSRIMQSAAVKDTAWAKSVLATETHMAVPAASKRIHVRMESGNLEAQKM
ncbi:hypothetical protein BDR06DRAFT_972523 [Suillus hirtellus]|nr:hypothetical protein BDR06DRAFT_972523 [Suillus hirtellus]